MNVGKGYVERNAFLVNDKNHLPETPMGLFGKGRSIEIGESEEEKVICHRGRESETMVADEKKSSHNVNR